MIRAIVVDDENETRQGLVDCVPWAKLGIDEVMSACNGEEAIAVCAACRPDIIISDIRMPRLNGIAFIERVLSFLPQSKIIFISGYSDKEYLKFAIQCHAAAYIEKPLNLTNISSVLSEAVAALHQEKISRAVWDKNAALRRNIALELAEGPAVTPEFLLEIGNVCPEFLGHKSYRAFVLKAEHRQETGPNGLLTERQMDALEEILRDYFPAILLARPDTAGLAIHACDPPPDGSEALRETVNAILERAEHDSRIGVKPFIAAGTCVHRVEDIRRSYENALSAAGALFFTGYGAAVFYAGENAGHDAYKIEDGLTGQWEACLNANDSGHATRILDSLLRGFQEHIGSDSNQARDIFYKLAVQLYENGIKRGHEKEGASEETQNYIWKIISEAKTLREIYTYVRNKTERYFVQADNAQKYQSVYRIMRYIDANLSDKSLSVNMLSEKMHFSPAHISHMFKKKTGGTVSQYITLQRMEKAKMILRDRDRKLPEVAGHVGFSDANYFTRIFKKVTGMTPSEYREKYIV